MTPQEFLTDNLIKGGYLKTPYIIKAFQKIDRANFVPEKLRREAYIDAPLPIAAGQTISQPLTVAFMMELLKPEPGDKILDVGYGSGWTTALLAEIVGEKGEVFAIERVPELCEFGKQNVSKYFSIKDYPSINSRPRRGSLKAAGNKGAVVEMKRGDGTKGWPENAPFDKIIAGASGESLPEAWKKQLKIGGRIVVPIKWSIWLFIKKGEDEFEETEFPGFSFVPLIEG